MSTVGNVFEVPFKIQKSTVASLEVLNPRTEYSGGMGEYLNLIQVQVTYNDGREPETISSSGTGLRQNHKKRPEKKKFFGIYILPIIV